MIEYDSPNIDLDGFVLPEKFKIYNPIRCPACHKTASSTELGGNGRGKPLTWQEEEIDILKDIVSKNRRYLNKSKTEVFYCRNKDCPLFMTRF